jgi:hypothetical protein
MVRSAANRRRPMVTVNYLDESPVTYSSEEDRRTIERIMLECGATVREIWTTLSVKESRRRSRCELAVI